LNREEVSGLLGRKVAIRLTNVEARGVELVATLAEVREDGVVLSEVGELGPGPTVFCPWESLHRVRERPPWLRLPHEEPGDEVGDPAGYGSFEVKEVPTEEGPEPPVERRRETSALNLERVVPIAQKREVGDVDPLEGDGEALVSQRLRRLLAFPGVTGCQHNPQARSGELAAGLEADAAVSPRHERRAVQDPAA
jgi:hypothetical protein